MPSQQTTDDEFDPDDRSASQLQDERHENEKLIEAFKSRHIRLRLHGTRLPKDYTITLRLPSNSDVPKNPAARRRRNRPTVRSRRPSHTSESDDTVPSTPLATIDQAGAEKALDTDTDEDAQTRKQNAYPGSTNNIGSVYQRRWFVLLDRQSSGFERKGGTWSRRVLPNGDLGGFQPFVVRGRDHERSVVTGRLAREVECDEGCEAYIGRGGWTSIED